MAKQVFKCRTLGSTKIHAIMINYCGAFSEAWRRCRHRPPMMISVSWWGERRSRLKWKVLIVKNAHDDEKRHRTLIYFDLWNWDLNETGWAGVCGNVSVFWQLSLVYKRKRIGSYAHNLSATLAANKSFKELWTSDLKSLSPFPSNLLLCVFDGWIWNMIEFRVLPLHLTSFTNFFLMVAPKTKKRFDGKSRFCLQRRGDCWSNYFLRILSFSSRIVINYSRRHHKPSCWTKTLHCLPFFGRRMK